VAQQTTLTPRQHQRIQRIANTARLVSVGVACAVCAVSPAHAQSLKGSLVTIFLALYAIIGVVGGIATLLTALNWATGNWMGREDPKKLFFTALGGTAAAFGVVALIQWIKDSVGGTASDINNL